METDIVSVHPDATPTTSPRRSRATICWPCPVVDDDGKMLGIVTVDDAIDAIMPETSPRNLPRFTARRHSHAANAAASEA